MPQFPYLQMGENELKCCLVQGAGKVAILIPCCLLGAEGKFVPTLPFRWENRRTEKRDEKKVLLIRDIRIMETHKNKRQECLQMLGSRTSTCKTNVWQFPPTPFCYFHPIWIPALPIHSHICSQTWYQHQFNHILSIYRAGSAGLRASQEKLTPCLC